MGLTLTREPSGRDRCQQAIFTFLYKCILSLGKCLGKSSGSQARSAGDTGLHFKHGLTHSSPQPPYHTAALIISCTDEDTEAEPPAASVTKPNVEPCSRWPHSSCITAPSESAYETIHIRLRSPVQGREFQVSQSLSENSARPRGPPWGVGWGSPLNSD